MSSNNTPTVSKSDLVPFVAAVLQDQVVTDAVKELQQQLNDANAERLLVQVTGRNGTPVHYQASLTDGGTFYGGDRSMWMVPFGKKKEENLVLDLNVIGGLEVRLSGNRLFYLKDTRYNKNKYEDDFNRDSDESQMGGIRFENIDSQTFVHGKIGPISWRDYSEEINGMTVQELAFFENNDANQTANLIITAVVFPMDLLNDSTISLLNKMGISTTYEHDQSWVSSVRNTGSPTPSTSFGDVRVGVEDIKSKLVLYLKDSSITFSDPRHANQQLKLLLEMVDDPQFSYSLRDYGIISTLISVLPTVFSRNNVDGLGETNEETLKTSQEKLKNQREFAEGTFTIFGRLAKTELWFGKEVVDLLMDESIFSDIFLERIGGYKNNVNRNIVAIGLFTAIGEQTHPNIGDIHEDKSIKLLERLSEKIDDKLFGKEGGLVIVSRLLQSTNNPEHETILQNILTHIVVTIGWPRNQ